MKQSPKKPTRTMLAIGGVFILSVAIVAGLAALLSSIQTHKSEEVQYPLKVVQMSANELDPAVWGKNFPREYNTFLLTKNDTISTTFGGSVPFDKLAQRPALKTIYAGYAFSVDYNKARGHYYALEDQKKTKRQEFVAQPGACANCHAAEAPQLIAQMGWENFNHTPYKEISSTLHLGTSCADCHDPETMDLRITRPAFANAMAERGIDLTQATRQEMRTYVCAQCHVEYYFKGDNKVLTFPWDKGVDIDQIVAYYDATGFKDWTHPLTGAPMLKAQHPEFEMWSSSIHARSGVSCADCHMAYVRDGAVKVSDHWLRSPLTNINQACQPCHKQTEEELKNRIIAIQTTTNNLQLDADKAMTDAIAAIKAAKDSGAGDDALKEARNLHRQASFRWDFVSSENSTGFHSPQEATRILANAINYARQAQLAAERLTPKK
jgi:nitrite reductase (cytochrome c-552)